MLHLLLTAALTAPAHGEEPAPTPAAEAAEGVVEAEPAPARPTARAVELLSPGRGGRRPLRVSARADDGWRLQLRRSTSTTAVVDGGPLHREAQPDTVHELSVRVAPDAVDLRVLSAEQVGEELERQLELAEAVKELGATPWTAPLDPRQRTVPGIVSIPSEAEATHAEVVADIAWALDLAAVPLPEERVGRGAQWRVVRAGTEQGVPVTQTATYTLLRSRGHGVVVGLALQIEAPGGTTLADARVERLRAEGTGTTWLDLRRPLAQAADLTLHGNLVLGWTEDEVDHRAEGGFDTHLVLAVRELAR